MTNILIIGNGVHAIRYLETYLFCNDLNVYFYKYNKDSKNIINKYGAKTESNIEEINKYDVVFLALPIDERDPFLEVLISKNYDGIILLEKPLSMNYLQAKKILIRTKNMKLGVIYNRQFEKEIDYSKLYYEDTIIIKWPNLARDHIDPIVNTMANILDTLFIICGYNKIKSLQIKHDEGNYIVTFRLNKSSIKIKIYDTNDDKDKIKINDKVLEWPNYFETNINIIKEILSSDYDFESNKKKALLNAQTLDKIEKYIRRHNDSK